MRLCVAAVGRLKEGAERDLVARYSGRLQAMARPLGFSGFDIVEVPEGRSARAPSRKAEEAAALRSRLGPAAMVALDAQGAAQTSEAFAAGLTARRDAGEGLLAFVIGGADGLDPALLAEARQRLSFGTLTLPHQLVRVLVIEQLYRAMTILAGHPYHRA